MYFLIHKDIIERTSLHRNRRKSKNMIKQQGVFLSGKWDFLLHIQCV